MKCFSCSMEIVVEGRVGRSERCPACSADLHCCRNCKFYDPQAYNECRERVAERVLDKEVSNFCDYFQMAEKPFRLKEDKVSEAKKKLEGLFRRK